MEPQPAEVVTPDQVPDLTPERVTSLVALGQDRTGALSLNEVQTYAEIFVKSGLFKTKGGDRGLAETIVKVQAGQELGVPPFASMRGLNIMDGGKVELSAGLMAAKVQESNRYKYRIIEATAERCVLQWSGRDDRGQWEPLGESEWTIEEAKSAGYVKDGSAWKRTPSDMLFARSLSRGFRRYCPQLAIGGTLYVEGELVETSPAEPAKPEDVERVRARFAGLDEETKKAAWAEWRQRQIRWPLESLDRASIAEALILLDEFAPEGLFEQPEPEPEPVDANPQTPSESAQQQTLEPETWSIVGPDLNICYDRFASKEAAMKRLGGPLDCGHAEDQHAIVSTNGEVVEAVLENDPKMIAFFEWCEELKIKPDDVAKRVGAEDVAAMTPEQVDQAIAGLKALAPQ